MAGFEMPKTMLDDDVLGMFADITPKVPTFTPEIDGTVDGGIFGDMSVDLKGLGSIASVLGSLWGANEDRKYKKELLKREDERIARDRARQDEFDSDMAQAYA